MEHASSYVTDAMSDLRAIVMDGLKHCVGAERRRRDVGRQNGQSTVTAAVLEQSIEINDCPRCHARYVHPRRLEAVIDV